MMFRKYTWRACQHEVWILLFIILKGLIVLDYVEGVPAQVGSVAVWPIVPGKNIVGLRVSWNRVRGHIKYEVENKTAASNVSITAIAVSSTRTRLTQNLTGLDPDTTYNVRVRAVSSDGNGKWSEATQARTYQFPSKVTIRLIRPLNGSGEFALAVFWNKPSHDSRLRIEYRLQYKVAGQDQWSSSITAIAQTYVVQNLSQSATYHVRVRCVSLVGRYGLFGDWSEKMSTDLPGAVTSLQIRPSATTYGLVLTWGPPSGSNYPTPVTYRVRYRERPSSGPPGSWSSTVVRSATQREYTTPTLKPGTRYEVEVWAVTSIGGTRETQVATTYQSPGTVMSLQVRPSTTIYGLVITWGPPFGSNFPTPVTYRVKYRESTSSGPASGWSSTVVRSATQREYTTPTLKPGTKYEVVVWAVTSIGRGTGSIRSGITYQNQGPVMSLEVRPSTTIYGLVITWGPPSGSNHPTPITYRVRYRERPSSGPPGSWSTVVRSATQREYTTPTLKPGTRYEVEVWAVTSIGNGNSTTKTASTYQSPGPVRLLQVRQYNTTSHILIVTWGPPSGIKHLTPVTYRVRYRERPSSGPPGSWNSTVVRSATQREYTTPTLKPGTRYEVEVWAVTSIGEGTQETAHVTLQAESNSKQQVQQMSPTGPIIGVIVALGATLTIFAVIVICIICVKKKKFPACLSGGMTKVQGVRHSLRRKQKDEDYEMQPQPEVEYYQSLTVGSLEPIPRSSFSVHVKAMHMERDSGFEKEYQSIVNDPNGSAEIAMENRPKNRYFNIHTYDHSRVVLSAPDEDGSDYINASYIDGYEKKDAYIASQGPIVETISDFWEMVWEQKSSIIVMLTKVEEKGKVKCEQYWCEELDKPYELKRNLTVTTRSHKAMADYEIRDIRVMKHDDCQSKPLEVVHMQYTGWPDYGVPTHPSSLVKFVQQVRKEYKDSTAPMVVHCSAGVGRSGTFITIDAMMERLKEKDDLNIYQFVTEMRSKRTFMVQTMDQYAFIHDALSDYLTCGDTTIPAHHLTAKIIEMSAVKEETNTTQFQDQFEFLESLSKNTCAEDDTYSKKTTIAKKNRYKDKFPYSNCHLKLHSRNSSNGGDYINASFIDSFSRSKGFIAAQAPLENTKNDVWQLIWQFKIPTVVVLCGFKEERQVTCCRFWPDETIKSIEYDHIKVNHASTTSKTGYEITKLDAFEKGMDTNQVSVTLFHVNNWSKSGSMDLNLVLKLMGDVEGAHTKKKKPIMVMCDDGMGRSGVFICAMSEVERVKFEGQVDVFQTIKGMRIQRPHMVDTPEHYKLCFDILLTHLDSFDTYANFKVV